MATTNWTGRANNGDWTDNANWSGSAPGAGDTVNINTTSQNITQNITGLTGTTVTILNVGAGYTGSIGAAGSSLDIGITTLNYAGRGAFAYIGSAIGTANLDQIGAGTIYHTAGTWTTCHVSDGILRVNGGTITTLNNPGGRDIDITSSGSVPTINSAVGKIVSAANVTTANIEGSCNLTVTDSATMGTANVFSGGTYNHQSTGTITALVVHTEGTFTPFGAIGSFTLTDHTVWYNGIFIDDAPGITITKTNPLSQVGWGG